MPAPGRSGVMSPMIASHTLVRDLFLDKVSANLDRFVPGGSLTDLVDRVQDY